MRSARFPPGDAAGRDADGVNRRERAADEPPAAESQREHARATHREEPIEAAESREVGRDGTADEGAVAVLAPVAEPLPGKVHAQARERWLLPIERQMVVILGQQHLGDEPGTGITFLHRRGRQRRAAHRALAARAGQLGPHDFVADDFGRETFKARTLLTADFAFGFTAMRAKFFCGSRRSVTVSRTRAVGVRAGRRGLTSSSVEGNPATATSVMAGGSAGGGKTERRICSLESVSAESARSAAGP